MIMDHCGFMDDTWALPILDLVRGTACMGILF